MTREERIEGFLSRYMDLCLKYNIHIFSCGCCNGPSMGNIGPNAEEVLADEIDHLRDESKGVK